MKNKHIGIRCMCTLCAVAVTAASFSDGVEFCARPLFCATEPAPVEVGPHPEHPTQQGPQGPQEHLRTLSTGPTGPSQASALLSGEGGLSADAIVIRGST
jgi:hypothetical protein